MKVEARAHERIFNTRWLWILVFFFALGEWAIIFAPDIHSSLVFLRQAPRSFSCGDLAGDAALLFFNFKVWVLVSLAQAIGWGVVAYVALRWLGQLWRTGEAAGRWQRVGKITLRAFMFALGLWFFLTPSPSWNMGCFRGH